MSQQGPARSRAPALFIPALSPLDNGAFHEGQDESSWRRSQLRSPRHLVNEPARRPAPRGPPPRSSPLFALPSTMTMELPMKVKTKVRGGGRSCDLPDT